MKIDKGIPVPLNPRRLYPFDEMEIGDSFAVPLAEHSAIHSATCWRAKRHGEKYTIRRMEDCVRVWRTA